MPKLTIDGREVQVAEGATVLDAARALGIAIPTLCHHPDFDASTSCMVCLVKVEGARSLLPSCATPAVEGMVVASESDEVRAARRTALELLASDHTGDCVAPCQRADAHHLDVPRFLRQVQDGDLAGAAVTIGAAGLSLDDPASLDATRAEKACRRGRYDETVAITELIRYVAAHRPDALTPTSPPRPFSGGPSRPLERPAIGGGASPPAYRDFSVRIGKLSPAEMDELLALANDGPKVVPVSPDGKFSAPEAAAEAGRCQHCDCRQAPSCALRNACAEYGVQTGRFRSTRPALELDRSHPEIVHEPGKCILCGLCLQVAARAHEDLGLAFVGRGFDMRIKVPFDSPLADALRTSATACADVCPTGALARLMPRQSLSSDFPHERLRD